MSLSRAQTQHRKRMSRTATAPTHMPRLSGSSVYIGMGPVRACAGREKKRASGPGYPREARQVSTPSKCFPNGGGVARDVVTGYPDRMDRLVSSSWVNCA